MMDAVKITKHYFNGFIGNRDDWFIVKSFKEINFMSKWMLHLPRGIIAGKENMMQKYREHNGPAEYEY